MAELYKSVTELMKTARGNKALQGNLGDITDFQQIIDDTPTADVVEVVRCKKCKHWDKGYRFCKIAGVDAYGSSPYWEESFCSRGERED